MASPIDPPPRRPRLGSLRMVWRLTARYPARIAAALAALIVAAAATLAIPNGIRLIIDRGFGGSDADIGRWFEYLLVLVVVLAIATALRFYFVSWLGERVVADLRRAVQGRLLSLSPGWFEENRPSEIASRLTADTAVIEGIVGATVSVALRNAVMAVGGVGYLFALAPVLAAQMLVGIPLVVVPMVLIGRRLRSLSRSSQDRIADVGAMVDEQLGAVRIVQAFGQQQRETSRFADAVEQAFATARRRLVMRAGMTAIVITLVFGAITFVMWGGAMQVADGSLSGGTIGAFILTGGLVAGAFGSLTEVYSELLRGAGAADRLHELLSEQPTIAAPAVPLILPEPARGALVFDGVDFRYPTRPEVSALDGFSLAIAPGETVAVVGPSGAGKSTLFQLAERFYDPHAGRITIDGVDLRQADPADVRRRIALVPQEPVLFAASARDNLRYGDWDADDAVIWRAAEAANAAGFLSDLPDGLDTFLGEGGARLSGGQRQRIAIARALIRDAPILLLDEATSALDAESERLVQTALERLMVGRTTLVIAHRLATVRAARRIVVMDGGRIVEQGDHATLAAAGGLYSRLARLQFGSEAA